MTGIGKVAVPGQNDLQRHQHIAFAEHEYIIYIYKYYNTDMKGTYLGEFEEIVLLAVGILRDNAYGVSIRQEIEDQTQRNVNIGAVHTALHRLEEKGYLSSQFGEAEEVRGGKRKRLFSLTNGGIKALRDAQAIRKQMWSQLPKIILQQS
ncbi:MAG TPA: helix-turn-helix transcriptional regulator [Chryseolinea sp.]